MSTTGATAKTKSLKSEGEVTASQKRGEQSAKPRKAMSVASGLRRTGTSKQSLRERTLVQNAEATERVPPLNPELFSSDIEEKRARLDRDLDDLSIPLSQKSEDEWSEGSSKRSDGQATTADRPARRESFLPSTSQRKGLSMDLATERANELLQLGKDSLEQAGNMKRECKATVHECLQEMYVTVLSLADSRSRHRLSLEQERARHARELVCVERAHRKELNKILETHTHKLEGLAQNMERTLQETESVRSWLVFEMPEPLQEIRNVNNKIDTLVQDLASIKTSEEGTLNKITKRWQALTETTALIDRRTADVAKHLADLKTAVEDLGACRRSPQKQLQLIPDPRLELVQAELREVGEKLNSLINRPQCPPPRSDKKILEAIAPVTKNLTAIGNRVQKLAEKTEELPPPPQPSIGAEIILTEVKQHLQDLRRGVSNLEEGQNKSQTYAQAVSLPAPERKQKTRSPPSEAHTIIVSSKNPNDTAENVYKSIFQAAEPQKTGIRVDKVRKARGQKVILSCNIKEDATKLAEQLRNAPRLKVNEATNRNPLAVINNVLAYHSDAELLKTIRAQNPRLFAGLEKDQDEMRVRYRKRARNPLECHPVLELSPILWKRMTETGAVYVGLQRRPIFDQSPLTQCTRCLGYGHSKKVCREEKDRCGHCGETHTADKCPRKDKPPSCRNCSLSKTKYTDGERQHNALNGDCPERHRWDAIARAKVAYC